MIQDLAFMKHLTHPLLVAAWLALGSTATFAQTTTATPAPDDLRAVLEVMRSDVNGYKIRVLNENMQLTALEAEKFWPVYRQYEKDLAAVADKKIALLREFVRRCDNGTLDNKSANDLTLRSLQNVQARLDLWKKYQKKVAKAVSPARALQFLQVEHQMALFIDLNIAAEMGPLKLVSVPTKP
jgi:hypothetical protein